jgi:hypothetical protein
MNINKEEQDNFTYIILSRKEIDRCILNNEYNKAFHLLIATLNKLHPDDVHNFIKHYDNFLFAKQIYKSKL